MNKVKGYMALYGIKGTDIARKLKRSRFTVSIVVTGKGTSKPIQTAIVKELNKRGAKVQYADLWPERKKAA